MFKNLFKAAWKSDSKQKRLGFIADVDVLDSANQTILEELASNDIESSVRQAAMAKISNPQTLYKLYQSKTDNKQHAEAAFRQLIQSGDLTEADINAFLSNNPSANLLLAKYCTVADIRNKILLSLAENQQAEMIADVSHRDSRLLIAENLEQIECLEVARKQLKGKDKNAERVIKSKIDAIHTKEKLASENALQVTSIREKMEGLARYVAWSEEIKVKFFDLKKSWDNLALEPAIDEKERYEKAHQQVEADVKHHMSISLSHQNQEKIANSLEAQCSQIAAYSLDKLVDEESNLNNTFNELKEKWHQESKTVPHTTQTRDRFVKASKAMESILALSQCVQDSREVMHKDEEQESSTAANNNNDVEKNKDRMFMISHHAKATLKAVKAVKWPNDYPQLACLSDAIREANEALDDTKSARKDAKDSLDKLHKRISRLFAIAKRGEIKRAQRDLASIIKASSDYQGVERKKLDDRIEEVTEAVGKMGDWKDFAIEPKLIELCEKMEALPELEKQAKNPSANRLAKKIKDLQNQWKAMGSSDISESYWPRFKEAGDKAYEPCAEFFNKKREIQSNNLEKREPFITQMNELFETTDWDSKTDYKAVEERISQLMQSWKKIKDVEHGKGQKQWERFSAIKDKVNEKLDIEYDKNIKAKHALITLLEQISEEEFTEKNNEQILEKLKFQQSKWKQIGVTRRKEDQAAWVKFKAASDAVYEKIQGVRQEKRAVEDEQIDAYKAIHKQIHALAKTTQDLAVSDKEFEALEAQYAELPDLPSNLPEKLIERIESDYNRSREAYANAKDRLNQAKLDNELDTLAAKASLCAELEQLPKTAKPADIEALEAKINALEITNKDYLKRFAKRLKQARNSERDDYAEARRLLLIDCEILLDVESPKEDKDLRLQIQLDRMKQQGIGNTALNVTDKLEALKLDWLCIPGAEANIQKEFDTRFDAMFKK